MQWSKDKLKQLIEDKLKDTLFVVVSNREPYIHKTTPKGISCISPASGVTMALDPVLRACGGVWVAHGSGDADKKVVDNKGRIQVPQDDPSYTLRRIWLSKTEEDSYYYGASNEALWPLCHIVYAKPEFNYADWETYKKVNQKFADVVLEEIEGKKAFVFVQDYHLTLLPKMIKEKNPDAKVALFWHIPWPNPEAFRICPWGGEILNGMLGADLLGFHINYHVDNFLTTVDRNLEVRVDRVASSVVSQWKETLVRFFPISVDFEEIKKESDDNNNFDVLERLKNEFNLEGKIIGVSTDRIDYTKGLIEKMYAIERFFEKYPEYIGKFTFLQAGVLSRIHIQKYKDLNDELNAVVEKINWRYGEENWQPIILIRRHFSQKELVALYKMSDVGIISSLHDGMNLVAKEYVVAAENSKSFLVLSKFTGAARELSDAILINPYDRDGFADAIKEAIEMNPEEKARRMEKMKAVISENNIYRWAAKIIQGLLRLA